MATLFQILVVIIASILERNHIKVSYEQLSGKGILNIHIHIHSAEKPYQYVWDNGGNICIHTGEKPYQSELWTVFRKGDSEYPYSHPQWRETISLCLTAAQIHLSIRCGIHTGDKPYHCKVCDRCSSLQIQLMLIRHQQIKNILFSFHAYLGDGDGIIEITDLKYNLKSRKLAFQDHYRDHWVEYHLCTDGSEQDCSNSIAYALELLQFCTKP